jgi:rifampicin phosphotransferase
VSQASDDLIAWLGSATGGAEALGGKGASLDRLGKLGFRVPPGFCLTTAAFRAEPDPAVDAALADAVARLVTEVAGAGFEPRFAVRSSALGEDGSAASYAGLHETELDVAPAEIAGAVRRCWASLWSPAATAYRQRRNLDTADDAMAVVVQALVPAEASAVVFTRHPVTGHHDQLVLTAVRGLGDAMVSGTVTPDTYVVDKASRAVLTFEPGEDPGGRALGPDVLAALVELCLDVEARFGQAVDVEAAYAGERWYVLQARPITTGAPASVARS